MKIKVWCDSGANIHSRREAVINLSEWGLSDEEWAELSEDEKYEAVRDWANDRLEMGWEPTD